MNDNLNFQFGMYEPTIDSIIINTGQNSILVILCKICNSTVIFDDPSDIVYLYRLQRILRLHTPSLHCRQTVCRTMWIL